MSFDVMVEKAQAVAADATLNARYDGDMQLSAVGVSIPPKVRKLEIVVNWPRLVVDTTAEVLTVEGFECSTASDEQRQTLDRIWHSSDMDTISNLAHVEALVQGEAFLIVGITEDGEVRTTAHTRNNFAVAQDAHGRVTEACVVFTEVNEAGSEVTKAAYYTPERTETFQQASGRWGLIDSSPGVGIVPVIPVRNRARIGDKAGRSEMEMVIPFGDAGSRSFTLLQLATEIMSMPQRWIAGGELSRFKGPDGKPLTQDEIYLGAFMMSPDNQSRFGQFEGANLQQIISVIETSAAQVSAMTGIPPSMLGLTTDNPASAEAMRAAKERLIARCERKQQVFGDAWETWAKLVLLFSGVGDENLESLQTMWRDVASPSVAAKNSEILQAHAQGILSKKTALEVLPLTPAQRAYENSAERAALDAGATGLLMGEGVDGYTA